MNWEIEEQNQNCKLSNKSSFTPLENWDEPRITILTSTRQRRKACHLSLFGSLYLLASIRTFYFYLNCKPKMECCGYREAGRSGWTAIWQTRFARTPLRSTEMASGQRWRLSKNVAAPCLSF